MSWTQFAKVGVGSKMTEDVALKTTFRINKEFANANGISDGNYVQFFIDENSRKLGITFTQNEAINSYKIRDDKNQGLTVNTPARLFKLYDWIKKGRYNFKKEGELFVIQF